MGDKSVYYGIDPFYGEYKRKFPFAQAIGEYLPFPTNTFDAVLFMSSLDHAISPVRMLREAKRVGGDIIIWTSLRSNAEVDRWRKSGRNFDKFHQWAFSAKSIKALLAKVNISIMSSRFFQGKPHKYPETHLIIGRA
jgi:ubiquinone/menaquinone biosynthesis C-methylase UbiE